MEPRFGGVASASPRRTTPLVAGPIQTRCRYQLLARQRNMSNSSQIQAGCIPCFVHFAAWTSAYCIELYPMATVAVSCSEVILTCRQTILFHLSLQVCISLAISKSRVWNQHPSSTMSSLPHGVLHPALSPDL